MSEHYISVAMCTYNGAKYVAEQLESILNQTHPVDEIVVGDDGSTDDTVEIVKNILSSANVEYQIIQNPVNLGYIKNFENVIAHTKGDIIFLSDQDDVWVKEKVEILVGDLDRDPRYLLVFSDAYVVDAKLNKKPGTLWDSVFYTPNEKKFKSWTELFCSGYYVTGATVAFRNELFKKACPFTNLWAHDGWLAIWAAVCGDVCKEKEKLILYRQHENNQIGVSTVVSLRDKIRVKIDILKTISKDQSDDRHMKAMRYRKLYDQIKNSGSTKDVSVVKECMIAQEEMAKIDSTHRWKSLALILKCWIRGYYKKYRKKPRGYCLGDIISCFCDSTES